MGIIALPHPPPPTLPCRVRTFPASDGILAKIFPPAASRRAGVCLIERMHAPVLAYKYHDRTRMFCWPRPGRVLKWFTFKPCKRAAGEKIGVYMVLFDRFLVQNSLWFYRKQTSKPQNFLGNHPAPPTDHQTLKLE